jgi:lipopolysaccharide transport system ATP-binding protein
MTDTAVRIHRLGKMFRLYANPFDRIVDALGIGRLAWWKKKRYSDFWALRDISLSVRRGERIGIIGRNGAGKSTLLKTICGNLQPTEGECEVHGRVQALLEMGTGFHPEFTGRQNIRASLAYQGLSPAGIREVEEEIIDFAELDEFIDQPVKTFSAGMYARLAFSVATSVRPELLIIDEVLGAGDAYFSAKCAGKMKDLVEDTGTTVLLVSHATEQVLRYCDQCLWLERGKIVRQGPALDVVKAYLEFIHGLEERQLQAKNRRRSLRVRGYETLANYTDNLAVGLHLAGKPGAVADISTIVLLHDGEPEETLEVGGIQDADTGHPAMVSFTGSAWSEPQREGDIYFRRLAIEGDTDSAANGYALFYSYGLRAAGDYAVQVRYRRQGEAGLSATIHHNGKPLGGQVVLPAGDAGWLETTVPLPRITPAYHDRSAVEQDAAHGAERPGRAAVSRWPGEGSLLIERAELLGDDGLGRTVFRAGDNLLLRMTVRAVKPGAYQLVPTATLYRLDGIPISNFIGPCCALFLAGDETRDLQLDLGRLMLGDGDFTFSLAIFDGVVEGDRRYDLLAYSYEFKVVDNPPLHRSFIFQHPSDWKTVAETQPTEVRCA